MWVKTDSSHAFIRVCVCVPVSVHIIVFACVSFVTVSNCVRVIVSLFFTYVGFVFSLSFPACVCRTVISGSALDSILVSSHQQTNSEAWCSSRLRRRGRCTQTHFFPAHSQRTIHRKQLIGDRPPLLFRGVHLLNMWLKPESNVEIQTLLSLNMQTHNEQKKKGRFWLSLQIKN